ncbi:insecticidal delta-endotoxin Cry8Ea1 family protein [Burkholderia alba]|uniref:insecticidal delta-endotoxin Cry8Ea1 family protein n=1 Tax=Burkholderia alba TaxID=2683677 RepID=UPI002B056CA8|nr:insecticidal delta-endotoxin Cry8Ea1 family protein [Burkholderia alba]
MSTIPHLDMKLATPPGSKNTIEEMLDNFKNSISGGTFSGGTFTYGYENDEPYLAAVDIAETAALAAVAVIPGVGWLVSGVMALAFSFLNDLLKQSDNSYVKVIKEIVHEEIDKNNLSLMSAAVSGIFDAHKDFVVYVNSVTPPYDSEIQEEIISKASALRLIIRAQMPTLLIKDTADDQYQGLPLYCLVASLYLDIYQDFLKKKNYLNMSDESYNANLKEYNEALSDIQSNINKIINKWISDNKSISFLKRNKFFRTLYLGGLAKLCGSVRKGVLLEYEKNVNIRNSMEIFLAEAYYDDHGNSDDRDAMVRRDMVTRASPLLNIVGYGHEQDYANPSVLQITQKYCDSKFVDKEIYYASCWGRVDDRNRDIDTNFTSNAAQSNGYDSTLKYAIDKVEAAYNGWDNDATTYPLYAYKFSAKDDVYDLGDIDASMSDLVKKVKGSASGYFVSGMVVDHNPPNGSNACSVDSGPSVGYAGTVFRHWSSFEHIPTISRTNGAECDLNCGWNTDNKIIEATPDPLLGKNCVKIPAQSEIKFTVNSDLQHGDHYTVILYCSLCSSEANPDYNKFILSTKNSSNQGNYEVIDGPIGITGIYKILKFKYNNSIEEGFDGFSIKYPGDYDWYFSTAIIVPNNTL